MAGKVLAKWDNTCSEAIQNSAGLAFFEVKQRVLTVGVGLSSSVIQCLHKTS